MIRPGSDLGKFILFSPDLKVKMTLISNCVVQFRIKQVSIKIVDSLFKEEIRTRHDPVIGIVVSYFQRLDPHLKTVFRNPVFNDRFNFFPDGFHRLLHNPVQYKLSNEAILKDFF
jgi:hypothetical protein